MVGITVVVQPHTTPCPWGAFGGCYLSLSRNPSPGLPPVREWGTRIQSLVLSFSLVFARQFQPSTPTPPPLLRASYSEIFSSLEVIGYALPAHILLPWNSGIDIARIPDPTTFGQLWDFGNMCVTVTDHYLPELSSPSIHILRVSRRLTTSYTCTIHSVHSNSGLKQ
jgi:hypothetical protein